MPKSDKLNDWLFHFSPYKDMWFAFKRDHLIEYFNGDYTNVLKSDSIKTLEKFIITNG